MTFLEAGQEKPTARGRYLWGFADTELNPKPRRPKTIHIKMCEYISSFLILILCMC